jgi:hypothetical protein
MALSQVTDPALLAQLNALQPVTDPSLLAQLNAPQIERTQGGLYHFKSPAGVETFSKNAPPAGSTPYETPTAATAGTDAQNFAAGAGKAFHDVGLGAQQLYAMAADKLDSGNRSADMQQQVDEARQTDAPLMGTKAGLTGNIAGSVAMLGPVAPEGILAAGAIGAGLGALQPVATGDSSRLSNIGAGAAFGAGGAAAAKILPRIAQPLTNILSPEERGAVDTLRQAGVPLTAGQRTGSPFMNRLAAALQDTPLTAGTAANLKADQALAINRGLLRTIGENADAATPEVMGAAKARISSVYNGIAARNPVALDTQLAGDLQQITRDAVKGLTADQAAVVQGHVNDVIAAAAKNNGTIDGGQWKKLYSQLGKLTSNPLYGEHARDLREALQGALVRSAQDPADIAALQQADQQWRAMRQIEGAISPDVRGNILFRKLANSLQTKGNRAQSIYGQGSQDVVDLARSANTILPDVLGNSGTPGRLQAAAAPGVLANVAIDVARGEPVEAAKTAAFGIAPRLSAPLALGTGRMSDYMATGVQNRLARMLLQSPNNPAIRAMLERGMQPAVPLLAQALNPAYGAGQ